MLWCSSTLSEFHTSLSKVLILWYCVKVKQRYLHPYISSRLPKQFFQLQFSTFHHSITTINSTTSATVTAKSLSHGVREVEKIADQFSGKCITQHLMIKDAMDHYDERGLFSKVRISHRDWHLHAHAMLHRCHVGRNSNAERLGL